MSYPKRKTKMSEILRKAGFTSRNQVNEALNGTPITTDMSCKGLKRMHDGTYQLNDKPIDLAEAIKMFSEIDTELQASTRHLLRLDRRLIQGYKDICPCCGAESHRKKSSISDPNSVIRYAHKPTTMKFKSWFPEQRITKALNNALAYPVL